MTRDEIKQRHPGKIALSYSQVKKHVKCPRRWQLDYGMGMAPPSNTVHTIGGTAFHEAVQEWLTVLYGDGAAAAARVDVRGTFRQRMKEEYKKARAESEDEGVELGVTPGDVAEYYGNSLHVIDRLIGMRRRFFDPQETALHGIELPIEHVVNGDVLFMGFLDVVLRDRETGDLTIIDIKTSTKGWSKFKREDHKVTNQLAAYRHFLALRENISPERVSTYFLICQRETTYWQRNTVSAFEPDTGPERRDEFLEWMHALIDGGLDNAEHVTSPDLERRPGDFKCVWCPFSAQFGETDLCDQKGEVFDGYPEGMRPYIDDRWIDGD